MNVTGSCHCGEIHFIANADPSKTRICHCTDCQKLSGSPFRIVVPVSENDFKMLSGEPKIYVKISESGNERQQAFCASCGTPIYATSNGSGPKKIGIRIGTLDERDKFIPQRQFWTQSALKWIKDISSLQAFDRQ